MRKVNCGGTTPYWLRAAQLKAGGCCSVELENSSYRRIRPLAPILSPNRIRLITGNCRIPCCVFAKPTKLEWPLQAQSQGIKIENPVVAHAAGSHSPQWEGLSGTAKLIQRRFVIVAEAAGMTLDTESYRLRGSDYGFLIRVLHLLEGWKYNSKEFPLPRFFKT